MFKVGMIVACFYIWSGQNTTVQDNSIKSDPMRLVAKVLAVHKTEKLESNAKPDDSASESTKKELTFLELEAESKKIRYFINASACKPSPMAKLTDDGKSAEIKAAIAAEKQEPKIEDQKIDTQPEVLNPVITDTDKKEESKLEQKEDLKEEKENLVKEAKEEAEIKKTEEKEIKDKQENVLKDVTKDILRGIGF